MNMNNFLKKDNGKWWEHVQDPQTLFEYTQKQERVIDQLQKQLYGNTNEQNRIIILSEFFHDCKESLSAKEIVVLSLKLAGYRYTEIESAVKQAAVSKSAAQRLVRNSSQKLIKIYQGT